MNAPEMTFEQFADKYCAKQEQTPEGLKEILMKQKGMYDPTGWMMLECHMLDSSMLGSLTILVYGPKNTFKEVPEHPISPRGLASDMSVVVALLPAEKLSPNSLTEEEYVKDDSLLSDHAFAAWLNHACGTNKWTYKHASDGVTHYFRGLDLIAVAIVDNAESKTKCVYTWKHLN